MILPIYEHLQQENRRLREINAEMLAALKRLCDPETEARGKDWLIANEVIRKAEIE